MALHVPRAPGFASMLKDGAKFFSGVDEAVLRNIAACKEFVSTVSSAYGPNGLNKIVINHLEKLFVTNDAATITRELEVEHPAVKIIVMASHMMEQEVGDGTNLVMVLAGALLAQAEELVRMGIKPTDVADGFEMALEKAVAVLEQLGVREIKDPRDPKEVLPVIRTAIMSKQLGSEDFLADLVTRACVSVLPEERVSFNVDNVRVCKIIGAGLAQSDVIHGMVFKRQVESSTTSASSCKVAVFSCPVDAMQTETKGTVLIKTAQELSAFSRGEEQQLETSIKAIADAGVKVVVAGGKIGDMALHYLNKYEVMAVRMASKWDIRRLSKTIGATALAKLGVPTPEQLGYADRVHVDEVGDTPVVVFRLDASESNITTILVRGATDNYMDDIERAIDDGVNTFKMICKDPRLVAGAGAVEAELARHVEQFGQKKAGLEQYAIEKFAEALRRLPRVIADNSGVGGRDVVAALVAAHEKDEGKNAGVNVDGDHDKLLIDDVVKEENLLEPLLVKMWGLKYAVNAACTVLRVDQIIMAKRAGGPKARDTSGPMDKDDDE